MQALLVVIEFFLCPGFRVRLVSVGSRIDSLSHLGNGSPMRNFLNDKEGRKLADGDWQGTGLQQEWAAAHLSAPI